MDPIPSFLKAVSEALDYTRETLVVALVLGRVMPLILLTPFMGGKFVPPELKMGMGLLFTIIVWPLARGAVPTEAIPITAGPFVLLMLKEVFIGFVLGYLISIVFWAVEMMGRLVDTVRGTSMSEIQDPISGTRETPTGALFYHLLIILFLVTGAHHIFLEAFFFSFAKIPLHTGLDLGVSSGAFFDRVIELTGEMFFIAVLLSAPVIAVTFMTDVAFGLMNKVAQQLNAYFMAMPIKAVGGLILILVGLQPLVSRLRDFVVWSLNTFSAAIDFLATRVT